jgi:hypothetical protein
MKDTIALHELSGKQISIHTEELLAAAVEPTTGSTIKTSQNVFIVRESPAEIGTLLMEAETA